MAESSLEDLLVRTRALSAVQLAVAKRDAEARHKRLAPTVIDLGLIDESRFAHWMSEVTGLPVVDPLPDDAVFALERRLPRAIAREFEVVPIALDGDRLTVATIDPTDTAALDILRTTTGLEIRPAIARYGELMRLVTRFYPEDDAEPTILPGPLPEFPPAGKEPLEAGSETLVAEHGKPFSLGDASPGSTTHMFTPPLPVSQLDRIEKRLEVLETMIRTLERKLDAIDSALRRVLPS